MKKLKTLGIATIIVLLSVTIIITTLSLLKIITPKNPETDNGNLIFSPLENRNPIFLWQTEKNTDDVKAILKTDKGDIKIRVANCDAGEKFLSLCKNGAYSNSEFSRAAENLFIECSAKGESFSVKETEYAAIKGAVAFIKENENAVPAFVIITADELSQISKSFLKESSFDNERKELYENYGGVPEYEGKIIVFGMVDFEDETVEKIKSEKNLGYTNGFYLKEPVKIISVEIINKTEN